MTMDESIAAAAVIEKATQEGDSKHVQSVLDDILAKHAAANAAKPKKPAAPEAKGMAGMHNQPALTRHSKQRKTRARGCGDWGGGSVPA